LRTITYYSETDPLDDPAVFHAAYSAVSPYRRGKVDSLNYLQGKKLSLGVELLLRKCLMDMDEEFSGIDF